MVKLVLDLRRHCIETAIRHRYNAAVQTYFKQEEERPMLEKEIALLLEALETLDFPALRSTYPALAGSTAARITLSKDPAGPLTMTIDGRPLPNLAQRKTPQRS
jgi:hypothetical protein